MNDANGNTTSSAGITNLYDFENRMTQNGSVLLVYDGDGLGYSKIWEYLHFAQCQTNCFADWSSVQEA